MAQEQRKVTFRFLSLRRKGSMCAYHRDSKGFLRCQYADGALQDHGKKRTSNLSGSQPLRIGGVFFSFFFLSFYVRGSGVEYLSLSYLLLRLREPRW